MSRIWHSSAFANGILKNSGIIINSNILSGGKIWEKATKGQNAERFSKDLSVINVRAKTNLNRRADIEPFSGCTFKVLPGSSHSALTFVLLL